MAKPVEPRSRKIVIEWIAGSDPRNVETYAWHVRCDPPIPEELVSDILADIVTSTDSTQLRRRQ